MKERHVHLIAGALAVLGLGAVWLIVDLLWARDWPMHVIHLVAILAAALVTFAASIIVVAVVLRYRRILERKNEELERLEQLKDDLTHMIVHDMKSPLTVIQGWIPLVREGEPELQAEAWQSIEESTAELLRMVTNLLDVTRLEQGRLTLQPETISPQELLAGIAHKLQPLAERENKLLQVEVSPEVPPVQADRDLLERVLTNLVNNALKHSGPAEWVRIRAGVRDDQVMLSVADNGNGIPPEVQATLFEKFQQAPLGKERRKLDTGLGLAFCKLATEAHGGRIWVESETGKGSIFSLTLPAGNPSPEARK